MLLIADGGSTKVDWVALDENYQQIFKVRTKGLNPAVLSDEEIKKSISENEKLKKYFLRVRFFFFYGAGCGTPKPIEKLKALFEGFFKNAKIVVKEDMLGAVYATSQGKPAIVAILGTGSNSCFFDGKNLSYSAISLGHLVMDEGSGNYFGKKLLRDYYYAVVPKEIAKDFEEQHNIQPDFVKENLYGKEKPNVYLAKFASFMERHTKNDYIKNLLCEGFEEFLRYSILPYSENKNVPIYFVGSIAFHFSDFLKKAAENLNLKIAGIIKRPIEALVKYHKNTMKKTNEKNI